MQFLMAMPLVFFIPFHHPSLFLNFRFTHVLLVLSVVKSSPNFVDSSHLASRIVKIIIIIIICRFLVHLSTYVHYRLLYITLHYR